MNRLLLPALLSDPDGAARRSCGRCAGGRRSFVKNVIVIVAITLVLVAAGAGAYYYSASRGSAPAPSPVPRAALVQPAPAPLSRPAKRDLLSQNVQGIYLSSWTAGVKRFYTLADMVAGSQLNALVIDVKDSTGKVGYKSAVPLVAEIGAYEPRIRDLDAILTYCREKKIHTIARIAVFQDPVLAKARPRLAVGNAGGGVWKDRKGLSWVDPAAREVWAYNVAIAKEVAARGFDEVQFDYVRFPTDGKLRALSYPVYRRTVPKHEVIKSFFQYVDRELKPVNVLVSADIFGLTVMAEDDLNIGQRIDDIADYVDFICPMIYPSHFPRGHLGLKNPADHPYLIIYDSCMRGLKRLEGKRAKMRPWLQDFKLGAVYDKGMILDQIRAARDARVAGFCMWNARNVYTDAAYRAPFPAPNPHPPLYDQLQAELNRPRKAKGGNQASAADQGKAAPAVRKKNI